VILTSGVKSAQNFEQGTRISWSFKNATTQCPKRSAGMPINPLQVSVLTISNHKTHDKIPGASMIGITRLAGRQLCRKRLVVQNNAPNHPQLRNVSSEYTASAPEALEQLDPLGTRYAAFRPRRLSAEELRDAMLHATGELNPAPGGIPNRPEINPESAMQPRQVMGTFAAAWTPQGGRPTGATVT
jgi:hypothetical protein